MSNPVPPEEQYLSTRKVAQIFDVSTETVITWIKNGMLDGIKINQQWRVTRESVRRLGQSKYGATGQTIT